MNAKRKTRLRSTSKAELVKINASKMDGTRAVGANQAVEQITMMVTTIRSSLILHGILESCSMTNKSTKKKKRIKLSQ